MAELVFPPRRGRSTERSEVVRALETKFCPSGQDRERDGVLSRFPALRSPQPVSLASPQPNGSAASNLDGTGLGSPGRRAFQQVPGSRRRAAMPATGLRGAAIRREHPEMVGESIVQEFLVASIVLCTFGSMVSVYE
jgi:hypothetical protein